MGSAGQEGVIVGLVGIPVVMRESFVHATDVNRKAAIDAGVRVKSSRYYAQRSVRGEGINRGGFYKVKHSVSVVTNSSGIGQRRAENVILLQCRNLARGGRFDIHVIK